MPSAIIHRCVNKRVEEELNDAYIFEGVIEYDADAPIKL